MSLRLPIIVTVLLLVPAAVTAAPKIEYIDPDDATGSSKAVVV